MGRSYAQLHTSIWSDRDFCALPGYVQRVYLLLISQPTVSYAGVLAYTERRFAAMSEDATKGEIADAMCVLEDRGYIVADEETEEVWVRSWCRYNGVLDHPNLRKAMASAYEDVLSTGIRAAIFAEYGGDEKVLLTTPAEPEAMPSRTRPEPDPSASVRVTSREDLDLDLQLNQEGERAALVADVMAPSCTDEDRGEAKAIVVSFLAAFPHSDVDLALEKLLAERLRFPKASDLRRALKGLLGNAPAPPQTHVLDETAAADRLRQAEGMAQVERLREEAKAVPDDPEERRRVLERVKARPA